MFGSEKKNCVNANNPEKYRVTYAILMASTQNTSSSKGKYLQYVKQMMKHLASNWRI